MELLGALEKEAAATAISQLVQTYSCLTDVAQSQGKPSAPLCALILGLCGCRRCNGGRGDTECLPGYSGTGRLLVSTTQTSTTAPGSSHN